jgi:hypothetical protein
MSDANAPKVLVGTTTKAGQYLAEPARLTWTTQKPTAPGLYGYRKSPDEKAYIVDVEIVNGALTVDNKNADQCRGPVATIEGEWAGPLLPPK